MWSYFNLTIFNLRTMSYILIQMCYLHMWKCQEFIPILNAKNLFCFLVFVNRFLQVHKKFFLPTLAIHKIANLVEK